MSGLDIFAWIVLIVIVLTTIAIFVALGMLPGHIAHERGHPYAQAVMVSGWVTLIFGFVLWPLSFIWAYLDIPRRSGDSPELKDLARRVSALESAPHREERAP